ncbi:redoxin domain-containing protein [Thalassotalea sp. Y01]|uniref:redoxin domain-containing protein n=1 Tax=Thalassotalea sp. Y01 TaxID=2729613 RepID=UPI00145C693A|nr:redoxin domain-containing protein [Thalassotalea sp. Y01]NMP15293.1 redoxin domain-containing protein [Thalassotalea sp. Y01]
MHTGQHVPKVSLPTVNGTQFSNDVLEGKKYLLSFFPFASCPLGHLYLEKLTKLKEEMGSRVQVVAVFESELDHLRKQSRKHMQVFPIVADEFRVYYHLFGVKKSWRGFFTAFFRRFKSVVSGIAHGYFPVELSRRMLSMPLAVLIDEKGDIITMYHGKDEGDHMPVEQVRRFFDA